MTKVMNKELAVGFFIYARKEIPMDQAENVVQEVRWFAVEVPGGAALGCRPAL